MLTNDPAIIGLLGNNPFSDEPPRFVRALLYDYRFTTLRELREERAWWHREPAGVYLQPVGLGDVRRLGVPGR
jgi:hypothetical protein